MRNDSVIQDLCLGRAGSRLTCPHCKHESMKFDCTTSVSLPLPTSNECVGDSVSLQKCFEAFGDREQLDEQKGLWYCPNCKERVHEYKQMELYRVPEVLIIHLKRFQYAQSRKIGTRVVFPVEGLDLSKHVLDPSGEGAVYDLYAVSEHSGGLGGGHYTATAKNWKNEQWYKFNDSHVTPTSASHVVSSQAYVLFYQRRSTTASAATTTTTRPPTNYEQEGSPLEASPCPLEGNCCS